jgi:leucyl aminopeptidase
MDIRVRPGDVLGEPAELAVLAYYEGSELPAAVTSAFEPADFTGKANSTLVVYPRDDGAPRRVLLIGLGARDSADAERVRQAMATAIRRVRSLQVPSATLGFLDPLPLDAISVGEVVAEGLDLGAYRYLQFKTGLSDDEAFEVDEVVVFTSDDVDAVSRGVAHGRAVARGVTFARDLVNRPGALKTPPQLAAEATALGERIAGVDVTVLEMDELVEQGFGGVVAVGKGSDSDPRFIILEYGADLDGVPTICLVGKGLTFDSGGLNVKTADGMATMKSDMAGSAAVLGAIQVVAELELPIHVVGLVPSAENMPSGRSYRPGDIITMLSGTTVEILNTDAEGRVILADGLHYATRYEPDAIVELSTLTGAIIVALGNIATGLMATDQALADRLIAAGDASGDRVWQMPLWDEYLEITKSEIADLKNHVGAPAGSIGAAAFLAHFVGDRPFAHLDIAGTGWISAPKKPYQYQGATGAGVRLLTHLLRSYV